VPGTTSGESTNTTKTFSIIQFLTMPIRSREPAQRPGFFNRQRPLHAVLGGGKRKIFYKLHLFLIKILRKMLTFIVFTFLMQQTLSL